MHKNEASSQIYFCLFNYFILIISFYLYPKYTHAYVFVFVIVPSQLSFPETVINGDPDDVSKI